MQFIIQHSHIHAIVHYFLFRNNLPKNPPHRYSVSFATCIHSSNYNSSEDINISFTTCASSQWIVHLFYPEEANYSFFLIVEILLIYSISAKWFSYAQTHTHIYIYIYILLKIVFHYRLLYSSLFYTVGSCCLSILYTVVVCINCS